MVTSISQVSSIIQLNNQRVQDMQEQLLHKMSIFHNVSLTHSFWIITILYILTLSSLSIFTKQPAAIFKFISI